jgi:hypothetical protein
MGRYVTLTLHGIATFSRGFSASQTTSVVRLRSQLNSKGDPKTDFVIVRSREELQHAVDARIDGVMVISNDRVLPEIAEFPRLIGVPEKFNYLSDGDIIGFHPTSKRFRTLYRRTSKHNSFLVTDRCNHYCLMCSQPPKDVDDRWILDEIKAALPIIHKDTRSLGFTGGEPLLRVANPCWTGVNLSMYWPRAGTSYQRRPSTS